MGLKLSCMTISGQSVIVNSYSHMTSNTHIKDLKEKDHNENIQSMNADTVDNTDTERKRLISTVNDKEYNLDINNEDSKYFDLVAYSDSNRMTGRELLCMNFSSLTGWEVRHLTQVYYYVLKTLIIGIC